MLHTCPPPRVRPANAADAELLAAMIRSLALYEGKRNVDHITATAVEDWFFGRDPVCRAMLAERRDEMLGYIAWYPIFSPFKGGRVFLVENLWVEEEAGAAALVARCFEPWRERRGQLASRELN